MASLAMLSCHHGPKPQRVKTSLPISMSKPAKGDKAIYGLACMGCSDTAVVLLPNGGGDPIRYNILDATRNHQVFGDIEIGDWICVMPCTDKDDKNGADMVIDLDKLKATWTYPVMPHLRDVTHLSKRQQARILANMPDSIVETYMIPRDYGFTLKRMSEARSVGFVMANSSVEDDSPVEYPEVPQYTEWHAYNGKLILVKGRHDLRHPLLRLYEGRLTSPSRQPWQRPGLPSQGKCPGCQCRRSCRCHEGCQQDEARAEVNDKL